MSKMSVSSDDKCVLMQSWKGKLMIASVVSTGQAGAAGQCRKHNREKYCLLSGNLFFKI